MINIVTIFLGLAVGSKLAADKFLVPETLGIIFLGLAAFSVGTVAGLLMAKVMNKFSKDPINPLVGQQVYLLFRWLQYQIELELRQTHQMYC